MNVKTNEKVNSSSQSNSNSNPFPKLVPRGSIKINQKSKKDENENISHAATNNSNLNFKGNKFLLRLKTFDQNLNRNTEEIIIKRNKEREKQEEEKRREGKKGKRRARKNTKNK